MLLPTVPIMQLFPQEEPQASSMYIEINVMIVYLLIQYIYIYIYIYTGIYNSNL